MLSNSPLGVLNKYNVPKRSMEKPYLCIAIGSRGEINRESGENPGLSRSCMPPFWKMNNEATDSP